MNLKMSRQHEEYLITLGIMKLLENTLLPTKPKKKKTWNKGKKWSKAQRAKFSETMRNKWKKHNG